MADMTTKILTIELDATKAINGIVDLNNAIDKNNAAMKANSAQIAENNKAMKEEGANTSALAAENQKLAQTNVELEVKTRALKDEKRSLQKETQNEIKMRAAEEGSLKALRAELSNLTKQWDAMGSAKRQGDAGIALRDEINRVTNELNKAEQETQRFFRNVGNYPGAVKPLRQELRELTMQLAEMERNGLRGSEAYQQLAQRAGQLKDNMADARREINRQSSDIKGFMAVTDIVRSATTAWQVYTGAMNAFGLESEEAMQAMKKLQGIMAITNGLKQLGTQLTNNETATYKAYHAVLRMLGLEKQKDVVNTNAMTAATTANTTAMTASTAAAKALRVALIATGIGAFIALIATLVSYSDEISQFFGGMTEAEKKAQEQQEALNKTLEEGRKQVTKNISELMGYKLAIDDFNGSQKEEKKLVEELNNKYGETLGNHKSLAEWKDVLAQKGQAYAEVMMLEAQAQAILNKYTEAYIQLVSARRIAQAAGFNTNQLEAILSKTDTNNLYGQIYKGALDESNYWLKEYKGIMGRIDKINKQYDFTPKIGGVKSGTTKKTTKSTTKDEAKEQLDALRKAEDAEIKLIQDYYARREAEINAAYDRQIEDVKRKKKLTEEDNRLIVALEKQKQNELDALRQEYDAKQIAKEQERIEKMLALVKKGTQEELYLRLDALRAQLDAENQAIDASTATEEEKAEQRNFALETYLKNRNELIEDYDQQLAERRAQAVANDFQKRINDAFGNELEILRIQYEQKQQLLEQAQQREDESIEAFNARRLQLESDYLNAKKSLSDKEKEIEQAKYDFAASIANGLGQIFQAMGEDNTAFAALSKVLALAEIAINTGKAIAAGIASAMSVPFPGNIAAIATTISAILAGIASATKAVEGAKFATGGYISGAGTSTSDSIPIRVSNGESVMNANTTAMFGGLLSSLNQLGGGVPIQVTQTAATVNGEDMLARAFAKGVAMLPNPVVSVEDINRGQRQVTVMTERARL